MLGIVGLLPLTAMGSAHAARGEILDPAEKTLPAQMDIRRVAIKNGEQEIVLKLKFRNLRRDKRARTKVLVDPRPSDDVQYLAYAVHRPGKGNKTRLEIATDLEFGGDPIPCDGITGRWNYRRDFVRIAFPQDCIPGHATNYRFKAIAGFWKPLGPGDFTGFRNVRRG